MLCVCREHGLISHQCGGGDPHIGSPDFLSLSAQMGVDGGGPVDLLPIRDEKGKSRQKGIDFGLLDPAERRATGELKHHRQGQGWIDEFGPQIGEPPRVPTQAPQIDQYGGIGDERHRFSPGGRQGRVDFAGQLFEVLVCEVRERLGGPESGIEIEFRG